MTNSSNFYDFGMVITYTRIVIPNSPVVIVHIKTVIPILRLVITNRIFRSNCSIKFSKLTFREHNLLILDLKWLIRYNWEHNGYNYDD